MSVIVNRPENTAYAAERALVRAPLLSCLATVTAVMLAAACGFSSPAKSTTGASRGHRCYGGHGRHGCPH